MSSIYSVMSLRSFINMASIIEAASTCSFTHVSNRNQFVSQRPLVGIPTTMGTTGESNKFQSENVGFYLADSEFNFRKSQVLTPAIFN